MGVNMLGKISMNNVFRDFCYKGKEGNVVWGYKRVLGVFWCLE